MRILIAPGSFGPALTAVEAAEAIAVGWARQAPGDQLVLAPVGDGGAGFAGVLHASLGGDLERVALDDLYGHPTSAAFLVVGDTAYVETAQVVGTRPGHASQVERASSECVGRLVSCAAATGVSRIVVGVGATGVGSNDGGAGLLAGLGAASDPPGALSGGAAALGSLASVDLGGALATVGEISLVLATDDEAPLLGLLGTTSTAGPARGIATERVPAVDHQLERFADLVGRRHALVRGAGAGGGIGFGLLVMGAVRAPGFGTVADEMDLVGSARLADLVVTGEEALDFGPRSGQICGSVAALAATAVRPCIALADRVQIAARETRTLGIESAYAVQDLVSVSGGDPADDLAALAARIARTWSWSR